MIQTDNEKTEVFKDIFDTTEYNKKKYLIFFFNLRQTFPAQSLFPQTISIQPLQ